LVHAIAEYALRVCMPKTHAIAAFLDWEGRSDLNNPVLCLLRGPDLSPLRRP
jgi:hypothetical protein